MMIQLNQWDILDLDFVDRNLVNITYFKVFGEGDEMGAFLIGASGAVYGIGFSGEWNLLGFSEHDKWFQCNYCPLSDVEKLNYKNIIEIDVGVSVAAAISSYGELYMWGDVHNLDLSPHVVGQFQRFSNVACGCDFVAALSYEGKLFVWGWMHYRASKCDFYDISNGQTIRSFSCGWYHVAMINTNGTVYTCGYGSKGQLGRQWNQDELYLESYETEIDEPCVQVACGSHTTLFLTESGKLYVCGKNDNGRAFLGIQENDSKKIDYPARVNINQPVLTIAANRDSVSVFAATTHQYVFSWGPSKWPSVVRDADFIVEAFLDKETPTELGDLISDESSDGDYSDSSSS